jgi:hypothetical protein
MTNPKRPLSPIVGDLPKADRRPMVIRPYDVRAGIFIGWGPKL